MMGSNSVFCTPGALPSVEQVSAFSMHINTIVDQLMLDTQASVLFNVMHKFKWHDLAYISPAREKLRQENQSYTAERHFFPYDASPICRSTGTKMLGRFNYQHQY